MSKLVQQKTMESRLADLERRIGMIERRQPTSLSVSDGNIVRVRFGKQDNGSFGLRAWNAAGALVVDATA